jgi:TP901 family phage tail tape measure protein
VTLQKHVREYEALIAKSASKATETQKKKLASYREELKTLKLLRVNQENNQKALQSELTKAGFDTDNLGRSEARLARQTRQANKQFETQKDALKSLSEFERRYEAKKATRKTTDTKVTSSALAEYQVDKNPKLHRQYQVAQAKTQKLKNVERDITSFKSTKANVVETRKEIVTLQKHVREYEALIAKSASKATETQKKKLASHREELKTLKLLRVNQENNLKALQSELTKAGFATDNLGRSEAKLARQTRQANKQFEAQQAQLKKIGKLEVQLEQRQAKRRNMVGNVAQAGAVLMGGKYVIDKSATLETAMLEVDKKASFKSASGAQLSGPAQAVKMALLEKQILNDAPQLGLKSAELANIVASGAGSNVARASHELKDLRRFSTLAAKMSNAFDQLSPEEAGKSVAAWQASMGLDMTQSEMLAGAINHLSDNSAANTTALTQVLTDAGAVVMSTGMNEIQAAGLSAAILAANGNKAEMGRTAAKNLSINMALGEAASGSQQRMWQSLGFNPAQIAKDIQADSVGTIYKVFESIKQQPTHRQTAVIKTLFGTESIGSIMPLIKNMNEFKRVMSATNETSKIRNSLDREFDKLVTTNNFQRQRLSSAIDAISASIGQHLLPFVTGAMESLADLVNSGTRWIANNKEMAGVIVKGVAALAALKAATIAWRLAAVSMDIVSTKRKLSETRMAGAMGKTITKAGLAARALDRLGLSLDRLSRKRGRGTSSARAKGATASGTPAAGSPSSAAAAAATVGAAAAGAPSSAAAATVAAAATGAATGAAMAASKKKGLRLKARGRLLARSVKKSKIPVLSTIAGASTLAYAMSDGDVAGMAQSAGSIGGSLAGAAAGAAIGSMIPVIGTIGGGIIGGIAGEGFGTWLGSWLASSQPQSPDQPKKPAAKAQEAKKQLTNPNSKAIPVRVVSLNRPENRPLDQVKAVTVDDAIQSANGVKSSVLQNIRPLNNLKVNKRQEVKFEFNNQVHVAGDADEAKIKKAVDESNKNFMQKLEEKLPGLMGGETLQDRLDIAFSDGLPAGFN